MSLQNENFSMKTFIISNLSAFASLGGTTMEIKYAKIWLPWKAYYVS